MRQELKTIKFTCDDCKVIDKLYGVIDEPGGCAVPNNWTYIVPNNWTYIVTIQRDFDGYGYAADLARGLRIHHFCKSCSEKREIREVFK